jgi:hypothetical protein
MPKYSQTEIELWISRANKTLYKLGTKSTDERFFEEDSSYEDEKVLIYCLKKAVSWMYTSPNVTPKDLAAVVSLLISRISIYDFGKQVPMYNTGSTTFVGLGSDYIGVPTVPGGGGGGGGEAPPDDITLVGGVDITPGVTSFTDVRMETEFRYRVVRNNINFYDWYRAGDSIFLTGVGDAVVAGDVFVIQFY